MLRIGIDIGGSKIAVAGCDRGDKLFSARFPLAAGEDGAEVLAALNAYLRRQCDRHGIPDNLVVASAPNIDGKGRVSRWPNRPEWEGLAVARALAPFARRQVFFCDDGTAATVADAWAFDAPQLAHFSLGTGVGGGICFEGRVLRDRELGHLLVHPDGLPCSCGRRGCLQSYASARALEDLRRQYGIDEGTNRWVAGASRALAACSANLIMLFGVTYVTLSGALAYGFPALPTMIGAALRTTYLENGDRLPDVRLSPHGDNASLQGVLALSGAGDVALTEICIPWSGE